MVECILLDIHEYILLQLNLPPLRVQSEVKICIIFFYLLSIIHVHYIIYQMVIYFLIILDYFYQYKVFYKINQIKYHMKLTRLFSLTKL